MTRGQGRFAGWTLTSPSSSPQKCLILVSRASTPLLLIVLSGAAVSAQASLPDDPSSAFISQLDQQSGSQTEPSSQSEPGTNPKPQINAATESGSGKVAVSDQAPSPQDKQDDSKGKQTKRMLWVVPNFGAVSANTQLPPMSTREKFVLAAHDSVVDYSSFTWAGILAGQAMLLNSDPELGHGIAGYGRYYWRTFTDGVSGTFFTEAIVPSITHEDPRYYTKEQGGFFRRTGYAISRTFLTKTDSGSTSFNFSEVVGNALEAGLSNAYYPPQERGLSQTARNWGTQIESAVLNHLFQEFWPDIRKNVFRRK